MLRKRVCVQFRASKRLKQKNILFLTPFSNCFVFTQQKNEKSPLSKRKNHLEKHVDSFFSIWNVKMNGGFFTLLRKEWRCLLYFCPIPVSKLRSIFPTKKMGHISILGNRLYCSIWSVKRLQKMEISPSFLRDKSRFLRFFQPHY